MNNLRRYIYGMLMGMIGEYLFRVNFGTIPFMVFAILLTYACYDIITEKKLNKP